MHLILIMIIFILLAVLVLKTPAFMTVVGVLASSVAILLSELINLSVLSAIMGHEQIMTIIAGGDTVAGKIHKAITGVPTNLILIAAMFVFYQLRMRSKKEREQDGKTGAQVGAEDRGFAER